MTSPIVNAPSSPNPPLNTKPVAVAGLTTALIGVWGPFIFQHVAPHAPADLKAALFATFLAFATGGSYAAYKGMPLDVPT